LLAGLHEHFNRGRLPIEAFSSQSQVSKKLSKLKKEKGLADKKLDRKPAPIEMIMQIGYVCGNSDSLRKQFKILKRCKIEYDTKYMKSY